MTWLITRLITLLNGLIGVTPVIRRVITQLKIVTKSHEPPSRNHSRLAVDTWGFTLHSLLN